MRNEARWPSAGGAALLARRVTAWLVVLAGGLPLSACGEDLGGDELPSESSSEVMADAGPSADAGTCPRCPSSPDAGVSPPPLIFSEQWRPQVHYSPPYGWMNDPNGLVEVNGTWHMYYQNNPLGGFFGSLSWGHAISDDLVYWKPVNIAIPFEEGVGIFSGSAVVDDENTSDLCEPDVAARRECVIAVYTANLMFEGGFDQNQNLAVSNNSGYDFRRYEGNPVLDLEVPEFRDPMVIWHEPTSRWIMLVARPIEHMISLFSSPNLREWTFLSEFGPAGATGGVWECPDMFELPVVDGGEGETRWVLKVDLNPGHVAGGSGGQYFIGRFDGVRFEPTEPIDVPRWVDWSFDFYCAVTWSDSPDGAERWVGWMNNWRYAGAVPTDPWRGQMSLPRRLELVRRQGRLELAQAPVDGLEGLREEPRRASGGTSTTAAALRVIEADAWELQLDLRTLGSEPVELALTQIDGPAYATLRYLPSEERLELSRPPEGNAEVNDAFPGSSSAPLPLDPGDREGPLRLRIFVDRSSIEVFGDGGAVVLTALLFPRSDPTGVDLTAAPEADFDLTLWPLRSTWR